MEVSNPLCHEALLFDSAACTGRATGRQTHGFLVVPPDLLTRQEGLQSRAAACGPGLSLTGGLIPELLIRAGTVSIAQCSTLGSQATWGGGVWEGGGVMKRRPNLVLPPFFYYCIQAGACSRPPHTTPGMCCAYAELPERRSLGGPDDQETKARRPWGSDFTFLSLSPSSV